MTDINQKKKELYKRILGESVFIVCLIAIWFLVYYIGVEKLGIWKTYSMPSPQGVGLSFVTLLSGGTLISAVLNSLLRCALGYVISLIVGVILGLLLHYVSYLQKNLKPLCMGIQTLPSICWVPFSILWFGLSEKAIIFVVIMGSVFGISISVDNAIKNIPPLYIRAALTMGASKWQLFIKVIVPGALPELTSGLKSGWSFAWRALMSGEVMTTCIGLGQTLITGRNLADINQVMLVMIIIVLVGILIDRLIFGTIEQRIYKHRGL